MKPTSRGADKRESRKEREAQAWKQFIEDLARTSLVKNIEQSLVALTTAHERAQIVKRVAALELLQQGKSYNEIGRILWLSPTTISALRKSARGGAGYVSSYRWAKTAPKVKWTSLHSSRNDSNVTWPHGKLAFPQKHRRY
ncbi:MAG: Trp family transcriptional regulator [Candidatus Jorgensenbacteria bacterium]